MAYDYFGCGFSVGGTTPTQFEVRRRKRAAQLPATKPQRSTTPDHPTAEDYLQIDLVSEDNDKREGMRRLLRRVGEQHGQEAIVSDTTGGTSLLRRLWDDLKRRFAKRLG